MPFDQDIKKPVLIDTYRAQLPSSHTLVFLSDSQALQLLPVMSSRAPLCSFTISQDPWVPTTAYTISYHGWFSGLWLLKTFPMSSQLIGMLLMWQVQALLQCYVSALQFSTLHQYRAYSTMASADCQLPLLQAGILTNPFMMPTMLEGSGDTTTYSALLGSLQHGITSAQTHQHKV